MQFRELLDPTAYFDFDVVGVAPIESTKLPGPLAEDDWVYIPQPLWIRLLALGAAYEMKFAEIAEPVIDTVFDSTQCRWLCEELEMIKDLVADPAIGAAISVLHPAADWVAQDTSRSLVVSPP